MEEKKEEEKTNKAFTPSSNKMVSVKINHKRAVAGLGKAGDVVKVSEHEAERLVAKGLATIVKEK